MRGSRLGTAGDKGVVGDSSNPSPTTQWPDGGWNCDIRPTRDALVVQ